MDIILLKNYQKREKLDIESQDILYKEGIAAVKKDQENIASGDGAVGIAENSL